MNLLPGTALKSRELFSTRTLVNKAGNLAMKKIWLPRLLYDALPYFYLTAGFTALFATLYISEWFWVLPHYLLFAVACLHLAYVVSGRRRGGPDRTSVESPFDSLDR